MSQEYRIAKVIQISKHRGTTELPCKKCGAINPVEELLYKDTGTRVSSWCPDCGAHIKAMPLSVVSRLYDFTTKKTELVSEISDSILGWYLTKGKMAEHILKEISEELTVRGKRKRNQSG